MKKLLALILALVLALGLMPLAAAEESVTPTPPEWCPEEEYAVFPGSAAYEPENWVLIQETRQEVRWGAINIGSLPRRWDFHRLPTTLQGEGKSGKDFGVLLEQALVEVRLLYTHDDYNGPYWPSLMYVLEGGDDPQLDGLTDQQRYAVLLWTARGILRYKGVGERLNEYLPYLMEFPQFSLSKLTDTVIFSDEEHARLDAEVRQSWAEHMEAITLWLDGKKLALDVAPEVKNQRTMVPIRAVVEAIGGDVAWDQETRQVTMTRAGSTVTMTLDSTTASVNGAAVEMDVAPYATNGRTLIPARYAAEFFGQKVDWDGTKRQVLITEDTSVAGDSNLEAWAMSMGAMLTYMNEKTPACFGVKNRTADNVERCAGILSGSWGIEDREDLVETVLSMTYYGHNASFLEMAADVKQRTPEERSAISAESDVWGEHMWTFTEELDKKWGDRGILAWDLFRMSNLVQWGYVAGYLTYEEALVLLEPAATRLAENFTSWDEAYENYLDGYNWWARNDVLGQDPMDTQRGGYYQRMKGQTYSVPLFDDSLFKAGVIPLPDGTGGV